MFKTRPDRTVAEAQQKMDDIDASLASSFCGISLVLIRKLRPTVLQTKCMRHSNHHYQSAKPLLHCHLLLLYVSLLINFKSKQ